MINKVIKLKLQFFIHAYVQATCQRDPEVYATCLDPKIYPHTKFRIPTSNYIQICSELDLARTESRGQGHSDLEQLVNRQGPRCIYIPNIDLGPGKLLEFEKKCLLSWNCPGIL